VGSSKRRDVRKSKRFTPIGSSKLNWQVGADNSYGHPTPQTLERFQKAGAQVFRNDEHGDVIVTIDGEKADVAVTKGA
jgi:hypothetical protein